jgi:hypothetical protein
MSKHKNPLKDLDQFLKQQAASFVTPTPLSERIKERDDSETRQHSTHLMPALAELAQADRNQFLDAIIEAAQKLNHPDRVMLINTALYLKHPDNWRDAVRTYWQQAKD